MKIRDLIKRKPKASSPEPDAVRPRAMSRGHKKPQPYRRLIDFNHRARYATEADATRVIREAERLAERPTISNLNWRVGAHEASGACTVWLWWTYGWVKGGWRGDGERFVATALRRAGVTPVENEAVEIEGEEKEPVHREEADRG